MTSTGSRDASKICMTVELTRSKQLKDNFSKKIP